MALPNRIPTFRLLAEALPSQPAESAGLKIYPVKPTNFSCRIGVHGAAQKKSSQKTSEILLTASQLRELAADLIARADLIEQGGGHSACGTMPE